MSEDKVFEVLFCVMLVTMVVAIAVVGFVGLTL